MLKTAAEKEATYLAALDADAEFFGLFGKGFPGSFYKVYVRPKGAQKWWCFENEAGISQINPIDYQARLEVAARATAVWAPLAAVAAYAFHPDKHAIGRLLKRAGEIAGKGA